MSVCLQQTENENHKRLLLSEETAEVIRKCPLRDMNVGNICHYVTMPVKTLTCGLET